MTILWGEEDEFIPLQDGEELTPRIPGASFIAVPEASISFEKTRPKQSPQPCSISCLKLLDDDPILGSGPDVLSWPGAQSR